MIVVGLTGGIGSGKSTVGAMLANRGATVIDADEISREVAEVGRPAFDAIVDRFGTGVLTADGRLDRAGLARLVFSDRQSLSALEAIIHPEVKREVLARLSALRASDEVVLVEIPLLVEDVSRREYALDGVLVVDVPAEIAVERLEQLRLMERADAERRIANQPARLARIAEADFVIMNMGSLEELEQMCGRAWEWIMRLRSEKRPSLDP